MTSSIKTKAAEQILEIMEDHPIIDSLENPNPIQSRWQFVYMFVANLALTGWGFVVRDEDENGNAQFYALPSTWVKPVHKKGPFAQFRIADPNSPDTKQNDKDLLDRNQVEFAYLPNPANPKEAYAPTTSQLEDIKINDYIKRSQLDFFQQGIRPNVIISIGKDPHPDADREGVRPRLTASQRRQVISTIQKSYGGVDRWSHPAIIDGLIEKIERLSMTNEEMGWDKSEKSVKRAILSIYGVHDFILGGDVPGSYAQAKEIKGVFFSRVNSYLDQLSIVITKLARAKDNDNSILIWWEKCEAEDPQQKNQMYVNGRKSGDISQNEYRAHIGLPPDEDKNECVIGIGIAPHVKEMITRVYGGQASREQAIAYFEGLGIPSDLAEQLAEVPKEPIEPVESVPRISQEPFSGPQDEDEAMEAVQQLQAAVGLLKKTDFGNGKKIARMVVNQISDMRK